MGTIFRIHKNDILQNNITKYLSFLTNLNKRGLILWLYLMDFEDMTQIEITYKKLESRNIDKEGYLNGRTELENKKYLIKQTDNIYDFYSISNDVEIIEDVILSNTQSNLKIEDVNQKISNKNNNQKQKTIFNISDYYLARKILTRSGLDVWFYLANGYKYNREEIAILNGVSERNIERGIKELKDKGFFDNYNNFVANPIQTINTIININKQQEDILNITIEENNIQPLFTRENRYKGPAKIEELLIKNNIPYSKEYIFTNCKYKNQLPFDFAIFQDDGLKCVIEYDGEQHFKFIPFWHKTEKGFEEQQERDNIKTRYCEDNNIKLIRIPYTQYNNIELILQNSGII